LKQNFALSICFAVSLIIYFCSFVNHLFSNQLCCSSVAAFYLDFILKKHKSLILNNSAKHQYCQNIT